MKIEVLYFAEFKEITGRESEEFNLSNHNLKDLVDLILHKYHGLSDIIWDEKIQNLSNQISVIINNQPIHGENILSILLSEGDIITFLLPVSGG
ncbi:MAG: MoaD/ThiS family protein [Promethearchaeota archaeon]